METSTKETIVNYSNEKHKKKHRVFEISYDEDRPIIEAINAYFDPKEVCVHERRQ